MLCNKCGNQLEPNSRFCVKCGNPVDANVNNAQMPQGTNQNVPPQYPPIHNNNKTMTYVLIFVGIVIALFVIRTVVTSYLLTNGDNIIEEIEKELDKNPDLNDELTDEEDTMRVGTKDFGYVTVPNDWVKFVDVVNPGTYQYSSTDGYIVTMLYYENSAGKSEEYATTLYNNMEDGGATNVTGARVKIGDTDAFQVYGYYPDNDIWLVTWMFEPGDGKTHYLSLEGPERTSENFDIPKTFSLEK